jgi:hypothetical protein
MLLHRRGQGRLGVRAPGRSAEVAVAENIAQEVLNAPEPHGLAPSHLIHTYVPNGGNSLDRGGQSSTRSR